MKTTAKFISASLATLLVSASAVTAFAAENKKTLQFHSVLRV